METEKKKAGQQLRNRCKGRAFDRAWGSYSSAFQEYFMALPMKERTLWINTHVKKVPGARALQNDTMKMFELQEKMRKQKAKEEEIGTDGCIQEEAECRMGGRDKLEKAIRRGLLWNPQRNHKAKCSLHIPEDKRGTLPTSTTQKKGEGGKNKVFLCHVSVFVIFLSKKASLEVLFSLERYSFTAP